MNDPRKDFRRQVWSVLSKPQKPHPTIEKNLLLRQKIWEMIEFGKGKMGRFFNTVLFALIIFSIVILPLELIPGLEEYALITEGIEIFVTAVFTVEYCLRVFAASNRLRYIFSGWGIIDLLSILPYYISLAAINTQIFRFIRLFRIVRILKIAHIKSSERTEQEVRGNAAQRFPLLKNEEIEQVVMRHPLFLVGGLIFPLIIGGVSLIIIFITNFNQIGLTVGITLGIFAIVLSYKSWLDYHYDVMYITNRRIVFQDEHLFGRSHSNVEYRDITNILPSRAGFFPFLFGYGSIILETSSDQSLIVHDKISKYDQIACTIQEKCAEQKRWTAPKGNPASSEGE